MCNDLAPKAGRSAENCMRPHAFVGAMVVTVMTVRTGALRSDTDKKTVAERITRLIGQLGNDRFAKREAASRELAAIGEPALPALRKAATSSDSFESRRRAKMIIQAIAGLVTKRELKKLEGTWWLTSYEMDGKQIKGKDKMHVFIFEGDKWSIRVGGRVFQAGTVQRIEVKQEFNAIDFLITEAGGIGVTGVSIYALKGESLKYVNGNPRPTEFITKKGDGRHYLTFRRAKP